MTTKLRTKNLYKVFGPNPERAMELARHGREKDEIYRETGSVVAVNDISVEVAAQEIFVVMGLSGSGKSTLVRCLNRLIEPSGGVLEVDGDNVLDYGRDQLRDFRLRRISMVFQHFALLPHKTVVDNVAYGLKARRMPAGERREKAIAALEVVGLDAWADAYPSNLSGGMQQRVGLARALAVDPEILLMDEPFSALDPLIRREMQDELIQIQKRFQTTIIFITHDLHEALTLGDQVAIMKDGAFVQVGEPEEIVSNPVDDYVSSFTQDVDRARVITLETIARRAGTPLTAGLTAGEARDRLPPGSTASIIVDASGTPVGTVATRDLAAAEASVTVDQIMRREVATLPASAPIQAAFAHCRSDCAIALVDDDGRLTASVEPQDIFAGLAGTEAR